MIQSILDSLCFCNGKNQCKCIKSEKKQDIILDNLENQNPNKELSSIIIPNNKKKVNYLESTITIGGKKVLKNTMMNSTHYDSKNQTLINNLNNINVNKSSDIKNSNMSYQIIEDEDDDEIFDELQSSISKIIERQLKKSNYSESDDF